MCVSRSLRVCISLLALIGCCGATPTTPADPSEAHLKIFKHSDLVVTVPAGWAGTLKPGVRKTSPPTLRLTGPGHPLEVLITPLVSSDGNTSFNSPEQLRISANKTGQQMLDDAKETSITLQDLSGSKGQGYYYTLTEKVTPLGSYEYLTNAFIGVGDVMVMATILHHQKDSDAFQQALSVLRGMDQPDAATSDNRQLPPTSSRLKPPASTSPAKPFVPTGLRLYAPENEWAVVVPGNFFRQVLELNKSGTGVRYVAVDKDAGLNLTVLIEPAAEPGDSAVARAAYWRKMLLDPIEKRDVVSSEDGEKAMLTYSTLEKQKEMNVFLVHRKLWVNIHVSKADFITPNDEKLFQSLVNGVGFLDAPVPVK